MQILRGTVSFHPIEKNYDSTLVDRLPCVGIPPTLDGNTARSGWKYRLLWMEIHPIEKNYDSTFVDRLPCVEIPPTLDGNPSN